MLVHSEEWCVEGETAEEARELLATGQGHRGATMGIVCTRKFSNSKSKSNRGKCTYGRENLGTFKSVLD